MAKSIREKYNLPALPDTSDFLSTDAGVKGYGQGDFSNAVSSGAAGLRQSLNTIGAAFGSSESAADAERAALDAAFYSDRIAAPQSVKDINSVGGGVGYIVQGLGKSAPEIGLAAVTGGLGGYVAKRAGLSLAKQALAGKVAAGVGVAPSGTGQALQSQKEEAEALRAQLVAAGAPAEQVSSIQDYDLLSAAGAGALYGLISSGLGIEGGAASAAAVRKLADPTETSAKLLNRSVSKGLKVGAGESLQELSQSEVTGTLAPLAINPELDPFSEARNENRIESAAGGFLMGAPIGAVAGVRRAPISPEAESDLMNPPTNPGSGPVDLLAPETVDRGDTVQPLNLPALPAPATQNELPLINDSTTGELRTPTAAELQQSQNAALDQRLGTNAPIPGMEGQQGQQPPVRGLSLGAPNAVEQQNLPALPAPATENDLPLINDSTTGELRTPTAAELQQSQNAALDQRLGTNAPIPGMEGQQGQQPGGEPMETAFTAAVRERPKVLEFLAANRFLPKSKVYRLAMKAGNLGSLPAALRAASEAAGSDREAATYERAYKELTGRFMSDDVDTAVESIVPESPASISAQLAAIADKSSAKDTMIVTKGDPVPAQLPQGVQLVETAKGTVISSNPAKIARAQGMADGMTNGAIGELLDYVGKKEDSDGTVIQALDANNEVVWEQATNLVDLDKAAVVANKMKPAGGKIATTTIDKVLATREDANANAPAESTAAPSTQASTSVESVQPDGVPAPKVATKNRRKGSRSAAVSGQPVGEANPAAPISGEPQPALTSPITETTSAATAPARKATAKRARPAKTREGRLAQQVELKDTEAENVAAETPTAKPKKTVKARVVKSPAAETQQGGTGSVEPTSVVGAKTEPDTKAQPKEYIKGDVDTISPELRSERAEFFDYEMEGRKTPAGKPITFKSLPSAFKDQWLASDGSGDALYSVVDRYLKTIRSARAKVAVVKATANAEKVLTTRDALDIEAEAIARLQSIADQFRRANDNANGLSSAENELFSKAKKDLGDSGVGLAESKTLLSALKTLPVRTAQTLAGHLDAVGAQTFLSDLAKVATDAATNLVDAVVAALRALLFALNTLGVSVINTGTLDALNNAKDSTQPAFRTVAEAELIGRKADLPFVVVDKAEGKLYAYSSKGERVAETAVVTGLAKGNNLLRKSGINYQPPAELRTTPAGKFEGNLSPSKSYGDVIALSGTERAAAPDAQYLPEGGTVRVAIHTPASPERAAAVYSQTAKDNRATWGCISPSKEFYEGTLRPLVKGEGSGKVNVLVLWEGDGAFAFGGTTSISLMGQAIRGNRRRAATAQPQTKAAPEADMRPPENISYKRVTSGDAGLEANEAPADVWLQALMDSRVGGQFGGLMRAMYDRSAELLSEYTVRFGDAKDGDTPVAGKIDHQKKQITVAYAAPETLLHEIFHAVMDGRVEASDSMKAKLRSLMADVKRQLKDKIEPNSELEAAFENEREFLNYYFTSPTLRNAIANVSPKKAKTVMGALANLPVRLWNALMRFLTGGRTDYRGTSLTIESQMQGVLESLLTTPARPGDQVAFMRNDPFGASDQVGDGIRAGRNALGNLWNVAAQTPMGTKAAPFGRALVAKFNRAVLEGMTPGDLVRSFGKKLASLVTLNKLRMDMEMMSNDINARADKVYQKLKAAAANTELYNELIDTLYKSSEPGFRVDEEATTKGNQRALASKAAGLSPVEEASARNNRDDDIAALKNRRDAALEKLDKTLEKRMAEPNLSKAARNKLTADAREEKAAVRAEFSGYIASVRERYNAERDAAKNRGLEEQTALFNKQREAFLALQEKAPTYAALYTEVMDHYQTVARESYETSVAQTMRRYDFAYDPEGPFGTIISELNTLQGKLNSESDPTKVEELQADIRKLLDEVYDPDFRNDLRDRYKAINVLRENYSMRNHAYVPFLRFGKFVVISKSDAYKTLVKDLEGARQAVKDAIKNAPETAKIAKLQVVLGQVSSQKAKDPSEELARRQLIDKTRKEITALEKERSARRVDESGNYVSSDVSAANARLNQLEYEMRQMRKNGADFFMQQFESEVEAEQELDALKAEGFNAEKHLREDYQRQLDAVGMQFLSTIKEEIKGTDQAYANQFSELLTRLYLESLPEGSALKRRLKREGIEGYSRDFLQVFSTSNKSHAHNVSRVTYSDQMSDALGLMRKEARSQGAGMEAVYDVMRKHMAYNLSPSDTPLTDVAARTTAFWFLGITPAFLVLNMTQNFVMTWPTLAARFGADKSMSALVSAMGDVRKVYTSQIKERDKGESVLTFEAVFEKSDLPAGLKSLFAALQRMGKINFTQTVDMVDNRGAAGTGGKGVKNSLLGALTTVEKVGWFLPHHTEVINRASAAIAAYNLSVERNKSLPKDKQLSQEQIVEYVAKVIDTTHGDYAESNKPSVIRKLNRMPLGKLLTLFKSYQQMVIMNLAFNFREAFLNKDASAEEKTEARRAFIGVMGTHALFAGSMGIPGASAMFYLLGLVFDDDEDEPIDVEAEYRTFLANTLGKELGEVAAKGVLRALPVIGNFELADRIGGANLFSPILYSDSPTARGRDEVSNFLLASAGGFGGIIANMADARAAAEDGKGFATVAAMMSPKALSDIFRALSMASDGATTRSGVRIYEPSVLEIFGQAIGLRPAALAESGAMRGSVQKLTSALQQRETNLRNRYIRAKTAKERREVMAEAREFYRKNPDRGNASKLIESAKRAARRDQEMVGGRRVTKSERIEEVTSFGNF